MSDVATPSLPTEGRGTPGAEARERLLPYVLLGLYLGVVFTRSEVISWFRIQEMFRFQAFHMYGIIGSAVAVAAAGIGIIKATGARSMVRRAMDFPTTPWKGPGTQFWIGGTIFGLGWGLLGACPGPIYVLIGNGLSVMVVALVCAVIGAWTYGRVKHLLPHS